MEWAASRIPALASQQVAAVTLGSPSGAAAAASVSPQLRDAKPGLAAELYVHLYEVDSGSIQRARVSLVRFHALARTCLYSLSIAKALEQVEQQRQQILHRSKSQPLASLSSPSHSPRSPKHTTAAVAERSATRQQHGDTRFLQDLLLCECGDELHPSDWKRHLEATCPLRQVQCLRPGCSMRFQAKDQMSHEQHECAAARHTQQLLLAKADGNALVECELCHDQRFPIRKRDLARHQLVQCAKRMVVCRFAEWGCADRFQSDEQAQHEAHDCVVAKRRAQIAADALLVNEEITCDWCQCRVKKRQLLDHQEDECLARERPCPNAGNGCPEWVPVGEFDRHIRTTCVVTLERNALAARAREKNTLVPCAECGAVLQRRHLDRHWRDECVSRIVSCKNAAHGCKARLRWRDRHVHEDFATLSRDRSMLQFTTGGRAYIALPSVRDSIGSSTSDLAPPWTAEYYVWLIDAREEVLNLMKNCLEHLARQLENAREHERWRKQADTCKRKLKALKQQRKGGSGASSNQLKLSSAEVSAAAKDLADTFNAAETGMLATQRAVTLAKGWIQVLLAEALRLYCSIKQAKELDEFAMREFTAAVAAQTTEVVQATPALQELVPEQDRSMLGDLERWAASAAPSAKTNSPERQQALAEQAKLLKKRTEWQDLLAALPAPGTTSDADTPESTAETERIRRRYERELAKVDAKLAVVSENTPLELLERRGRHVIASSSKNAIALVGTSGCVTFYRSGLPSSSKAAREVAFDCALERNRWHHVALSASKRELSLIVNGALQSIKRGVFDLPLSAIGTSATDGSSFQGFVQEVRYWRACRTAPQLAKYAQSIVPVAKCEHLLGYWTFEEGMGALVDDMALALPRAPCFRTKWVLYDSPAVRKRFGLPPTPSLRDKTCCIVNQQLKALAQRARDRACDVVSCRQHCGEQVALRDLDAHMRLACPLRMVVCREVACEQVYRLDNEAMHRRVRCKPRVYRDALAQAFDAKEAPETCELRCGAVFPMRRREQHYFRECPHRLVTCPRHDCEETIVAKTLAVHLAHDCASPELSRERCLVANARKRQQDKQQQKEKSVGSDKGTLPRVVTPTSPHVVDTSNSSRPVSRTERT